MVLRTSGGGASSACKGLNIRAAKTETEQSFMASRVWVHRQFTPRGRKVTEISAELLARHVSRLVVVRGAGTRIVAA